MTQPSDPDAVSGETLGKALSSQHLSCASMGEVAPGLYTLDCLRHVGSYLVNPDVRERVNIRF